ncbi:putative late blight resistance protein homolog R1B-16 [Salvia hispanica]|uniref:putative late blight resistance protein homolog R1B-16 n=1 Tax=Salvia hispanica TaxID=49212 RepID=UPI002009A8B7|nr:putative late blight resistance protein homolog R1B-16 [Salvia hispanica]
MSAYGALVSLMNIIDTLEKHPSPPISINEKQVQTLTQNITFLQEFLDGYISPFADSHKAYPLERRIADAVYAAEDVIESHIVDQIHSGSTIVADHEFYHNLQKVIEEMDLINKEVKSIAVEAQTKQKPVAALSASSPTVKENVIVGSEEVFFEVLDKLAGNQLNLQIIPITGMGGIGKTTLAMNLFENALVKERFNIRAWTTISQTYNVRETLREVLFRASGRDSSSDLSEDKLGQNLYQFLFGRRYLIIMDDMWSIKVWEKIKFFFPDNQNGSRIIVTTRLSDLSSQLNESCIVAMKFLDKASSWDLFCKTVFGKESCPIELEKIGKNVVANCKGLPLSIATIGGLLAKSERTKECWERIEQNLNSIVINSNDGFCLKILWMSYIFLPNYLKPCFLYMGVFKEDYRIRVSMLEKLWVSEGFLKPRSGKCLETLAREYFMELVDRNLVLVDELGSTGNVKFCKIHDLLRDLCLKEAERGRFYHFIRDGPPAIYYFITDGPPAISERRVVLKTGWLFGSLSHTRSIICDYDKRASDDEKVLPSRDLRLLRTFRADVSRGHLYKNNAYFLENVLELVNSRYLAICAHSESRFSSSIDLLWNLQTLIIYSSYLKYCHVPNEIWKLHQLRHLEFVENELILPNPPSDDSDIVIMENLQTLKGVLDLLLNEEVVKRIPNVKKLHLTYYSDEMEGESCLSYLQCFSKLENLYCCTFMQTGDFLLRINFPNSIKKLVVANLSGTKSEDTLPKIGSLPLLEKLILRNGVFRTGKWETIEGQFQKLKFLKLSYCEGLVNWIVSDSSHFPLLHKLSLDHLSELEEIPSEVGEIATLKSISLIRCSEAAVASAKKIVEEREDLYGEQLDLRVDHIW